MRELEGQFTRARQWGKLKSQNRKGFGVFRLRGRVLEGFKKFWRASEVLEGFWHVVWGGVAVCP